ncbi:MAG: DUF5682 family protein, partial [Sandaracinaceae bacterium]
MERLRILGVRHHSPGCARAVRHVIATERPAAILIEGPADMNDRLDELALAHRPPIAVCSYCLAPERAWTSEWPLADFSPEWVAIREGLRRGADVRLIDLPAWSLEPDAEARAVPAAYARAIARRLGADGADAVFAQLFEGPCDEDERIARLDAYFDGMRASVGAVSPSDEARERFMAQHVHAALAETDGSVLVVCGGLHAPALRAHVGSRPADHPRLPEPPPGARVGSYLVATSFAKLDIDAGYRAGVASPGYQQALVERGASAAAAEAIDAAIRALRAAGHPVSTADRVVVRTSVEALARLRGHDAPTRHDVLDGLASGVVRRALDAPPPWTERGGAEPVDATLEVILGALRGEREGALDPATPLPPLVRDVTSQIEEHDVGPAPRGDREIVLDLAEARDRSRSVVLHRLRILALPGVHRVEGPDGAPSPAWSERWRVRPDRRWQATLRARGAYGPTLETAAAKKLTEAVAATADLATLGALLFDAILAGWRSCGRAIVATLAARARRERRVEALGSLLGVVLAVFEHDARFDARHDPGLASLARALIERCAARLERPIGDDERAARRELPALEAIVHAVRLQAGLELDVEPILSAMRRRVRAPHVAAGARGAAAGVLWASARMEERAVTALTQEVLAERGAASRAGDFLAGLFTVAGDEALTSDGLLEAIDAHLARLDDAELRDALPSLRSAFATFAPPDRARIARRIRQRYGTARYGTARYGMGRGDGRAELTLEADPHVIARGRALEAALDARLRRFGLADDGVRDRAGDVRARPSELVPARATTSEREAEREVEREAERRMERWRLVLGEAADDALGPSSTAAEVDDALGFLYERDRRDLDAASSAGARRGSLEASRLGAPAWLAEVRRLFSRDAYARIERDALERYALPELIDDPESWERAAPSAALLYAVLRAPRRTDPDVLAAMRRLTARVAAELCARIEREVRAAFAGPRDRRSGPRRGGRLELDVRRSV